MTRNRLGVALAAVPLALTALLVGGGAAHATTAVHYECQTVFYFYNPFGQPFLLGTTCTGPVGGDNPGTVTDVRVPITYDCQHLTGSTGPQDLSVSGRMCS